MVEAFVRSPKANTGPITNSFVRFVQTENSHTASGLGNDSNRSIQAKSNWEETNTSETLRTIKENGIQIRDIINATTTYDGIKWDMKMPSIGHNHFYPNRTVGNLKLEGVAYLLQAKRPTIGETERLHSGDAYRHCSKGTSK
ncbi:hypothetical protein N9B94_01645 [Verrucomicrobia bacterium]|nr:hypothetical protein [Verrucomicrobiota bacterium]